MEPKQFKVLDIDRIDDITMSQVPSSSSDQGEATEGTEL